LNGKSLTPQTQREPNPTSLTNNTSDNALSEPTEIYGPLQGKSSNYFPLSELHTNPVYQTMLVVPVMIDNERSHSYIADVSATAIAMSGRCG
jgi:hypothetical protein